MSRFHAPEGSVTEQSVRMAFNYEYMVPIEVAWDLEQELNKCRAECSKLVKELRASLRVAVIGGEV